MNTVELNTQQAEDPFLYLPDELCIHIASFLPFSDVGRLALLSTRFKNLNLINELYKIIFKSLHCCLSFNFGGVLSPGRIISLENKDTRICSIHRSNLFSYGVNQPLDRWIRYECETKKFIILRTNDNLIVYNKHLKNTVKIKDVLDHTQKTFYVLSESNDKIDLLSVSIEGDIIFYSIDLESKQCEIKSYAITHRNENFAIEEVPPRRNLLDFPIVFVKATDFHANELIVRSRVEDKNLLFEIDQDGLTVTLQEVFEDDKYSSFLYKMNGKRPQYSFDLEEANNNHVLKWNYKGESVWTFEFGEEETLELLVKNNIGDSRYVLFKLSGTDQSRIVILDSETGNPVEIDQHFDSVEFAKVIVAENSQQFLFISADNSFLFYSLPNGELFLKQGKPPYIEGEKTFEYRVIDCALSTGRFVVCGQEIASPTHLFILDTSRHESEETGEEEIPDEYRVAARSPVPCACKVMLIVSTGLFLSLVATSITLGVLGRVNLSVGLGAAAVTPLVVIAASLLPFVRKRRPIYLANS